MFIICGEKKSVSFKLKKDDLSFYDLRGNFVFEKGDFKIEIGKASNNICFDVTAFIDFKEK